MPWFMLRTNLPLLRGPAGRGVIVRRIGGAPDGGGGSCRRRTSCRSATIGPGTGGRRVAGWDTARRLPPAGRSASLHLDERPLRRAVNVADRRGVPSAALTACDQIGAPRAARGEARWSARGSARGSAALPGAWRILNASGSALRCARIRLSSVRGRLRSVRVMRGKVQRSSRDCDLSGCCRWWEAGAAIDGGDDEVRADGWWCK